MFVKIISKRLSGIYRNGIRFSTSEYDLLGTELRAVESFANLAASFKAILQLASSQILCTIRKKFYRVVGLVCTTQFL